MSELTAAGSPTRSLAVSLTFTASVGMIAFGVGVWHTVGQALLARIVAVLVIGNAVTGLFATLFFPNRFGERPIFASPSVIIMFFSVLFSILAMVLGAAAFSGWLRVLSIMIPVAYVLLAVLRFATAGASSAGEAVTMIGTQERTMAYSFLIWTMALAIYLLLLSSRGADSATGMGG